MEGGECSVFGIQWSVELNFEHRTLNFQRRSEEAGRSVLCLHFKVQCWTFDVRRSSEALSGPAAAKETEGGGWEAEL